MCLANQRTCRRSETRATTQSHVPPQRYVSPLTHTAILAPLSRLPARVYAAADDEPWDVPRLQSELRALLNGSGLLVIDLMESWDTSGDDELSRREMLMHFKKLIGNERLWYSKVCRAVSNTSYLPAYLLACVLPQWYSKVRQAVSDTFTKFDRKCDGTLSISELRRWLTPPERRNKPAKPTSPTSGSGGEADGRIGVLSPPRAASRSRASSATPVPPKPPPTFRASTMDRLSQPRLRVDHEPEGVEPAEGAHGSMPNRWGTRPSWNSATAAAALGVPPPRPSTAAGPRVVRPQSALERAWQASMAPSASAPLLMPTSHHVWERAWEPARARATAGQAAMLQGTAGQATMAQPTSGQAVRVQATPGQAAADDGAVALFAMLAHAAASQRAPSSGPVDSFGVVHLGSSKVRVRFRAEAEAQAEAQADG